MKPGAHRIMSNTAVEQAYSDFSPTQFESIGIKIKSDSNRLEGIQDRIYAGNLIMDASQLKTPENIARIQDEMNAVMAGLPEAAQERLGFNPNNGISEKQATQVIEQIIIEWVDFETGVDITAKDIPAYKEAHHLDNPNETISPDQFGSDGRHSAFVDNQQFVESTLQKVEQALEDKDFAKAELLFGKITHSITQDITSHSNGLRIDLALKHPDSDIITYGPELDGRIGLITGSFNSTDSAYTLLSPVVSTLFGEAGADHGHGGLNFEKMNSYVRDGLVEVFPNASPDDLNALVDGVIGIGSTAKKIHDIKEFANDKLESLPIIGPGLKDLVSDAVQDYVGDKVTASLETIPLLQAAFYDPNSDAPTHSMIAFDDTSRPGAELAQLVAQDATDRAAEAFAKLETWYANPVGPKPDVMDALTTLKHPQDESWLENSPRAQQWINDNPEAYQQVLERMTFATKQGYEFAQEQDNPAAGHAFEQALFERINSHGDNVEQALDYYKYHPLTLAQEMKQSREDALAMTADTPVDIFAQQFDENPFVESTADNLTAVEKPDNGSMITAAEDRFSGQLLDDKLAADKLAEETAENDTLITPLSPVPVGE